MRKLSSGTRSTLIFLLGILSAAAVTRAASPTASNAPHPLRVFGGRDATQRAAEALPKLDASLAGLVRELPAVRPAHALADLHRLNPAAHFKRSVRDGEPQVLIDAVTRGDPRQLRSALEALGLEHAALFSNDVSGWLPVSRLEAAQARAEVHSMRASMMRARAGAVTSQGDFAQGSAALRSSNALTGSGVTVGVLSDSFNCYAVYEQPSSGVPASGYNGFAPSGFLATASNDQTSGDLPASVHVLAEGDCLHYGAPEQLPFADEGRALLQIVHDVAPDAALSFYSAFNGEADFANGISRLATAGAKVEVDDVGYFDEPFFQDGIVAQAIDQVEASGVAFFSAAGNDGTVSYDNTAPVFATLSSGPPAENLLNFDTTGATTTTALPVTIPQLAPGEFIALAVEWDQPYVTGSPGSPGASSRLDLCVSGATGSLIVIDLAGNAATCTGPNAAGSDPVQVLIVGNPADANAYSTPETIHVSIGLLQGSAAPGRIKLALDGDGAPLTINASFQAASSPTLQGHPSATGAMAVGVAHFWNTPRCGVSPALVTSYSSRGGEPILFDSSGARLAAPQIRTKPDVVDADGVNTTFFSFTLAQDGSSEPSTVSECMNDASYPNFFGTSAAAPHVAGVAALFLQYNPAITPGALYDALKSSADPIGGPVPNDVAGYGFVRADQALSLLPVPPQQTSASSSAGGGSHGGGGALDVATLLALLALLTIAVRSPRAVAKQSRPGPSPR